MYRCFLLFYHFGNKKTQSFIPKMYHIFIINTSAFINYYVNLFINIFFYKIINLFPTIEDSQLTLQKNRKQWNLFSIYSSFILYFYATNLNFILTGLWSLYRNSWLIVIAFASPSCSILTNSMLLETINPSIM